MDKKYLIIGAVVVVLVLVGIYFYMKGGRFDSYVAVDSSPSVEGQKGALILLFTDSCGYCKSFMPEWHKTKAQLNGVIDVKEYNCSQDQSMLSKYNAKGVPTVLFERGDGTVIKYEGQRIADAIINFVKSNSS
ncbi:MAG TPA: protein disulfide isomerase family protein [Nitrosarchaeum sp.]|nr:protein disulfide isomerase family protein [Nitrosarchaeum sp.]